MKKIIAAFFVSGLLANAALAQGPRFFCKSEDGVKTVRTGEGPWKLVAKVYQNEMLYQVLSCEQNAQGYLLYCSDDHNERSFRLKHDEQNGLYGGKWNATELNCQKIGETAE